MHTVLTRLFENNWTVIRKGDVALIVQSRHAESEQGAAEVFRVSPHADLNNRAPALPQPLPMRRNASRDIYDYKALELNIQSSFYTRSSKKRNMAPNHTPSPGNDFSSGEPPMRRPHLEFIYRIVAEMDPGASPIPNVHGSAISRIVLPIAGGTVRGPQIKGEIVRNSGADWAQRIESPKVGPYPDSGSL